MASIIWIPAFAGMTKNQNLYGGKARMGERRANLSPQAHEGASWTKAKS